MKNKRAFVVFILMFYDTHRSLEHNKFMRRTKKQIINT
jgi:hypothetical protein